MQEDQQRNQAIVWIQIGVVFAIAAAYAAGALAQHYGIEHPIYIALVAEIVAIFWLFCCSRIAGNSCFVDPHWSLSPIFIAIFYSLTPAANEPDNEANLLRQLVVIPLVAAWGIRLTYNWYRGFGGFSHEDWRYAKFRTEWGRNFWVIELAGIHVFQMFQVFLGCLALYPALSVGIRPFGWFDVLAMLVTGFAIWIEMTADAQLHAFISRKREPGEVLRGGVWQYSRHPNYFGEILFWWGLYLFGLAADTGWWWTIIGPLSMTVMFVFVSLPLIEKRHAQRRPGYAEYAKHTSLLVPWFPKG